MINLMFDDYIENKVTSDTLRAHEKRTSDALAQASLSIDDKLRIETFAAQERLQAEKEAFTAGFRACKQLLDEIK